MRMWIVFAQGFVIVIVIFESISDGLKPTFSSAQSRLPVVRRCWIRGENQSNRSGMTEDQRFDLKRIRSEFRHAVATRRVDQLRERNIQNLLRHSFRPKEFLCKCAKPWRVNNRVYVHEWCRHKLEKKKSPSSIERRETHLGVFVSQLFEYSSREAKWNAWRDRVESRVNLEKRSKHDASTNHPSLCTRHDDDNHRPRTNAKHILNGSNQKERGVTSTF